MADLDAIITLAQKMQMKHLAEMRLRRIEKKPQKSYMDMIERENLRKLVSLLDHQVTTMLGLEPKQEPDLGT